MVLAVLAFVGGFVMAFFSSMPPIGPIAVLVLERGVTGRDREANKVAFGGALAEGIYSGLAVAGILALLRGYPHSALVLRGIGVVLLIALGVYFARFKLKEHREHKQRSGKPFFVGFAVAIANPVLILTWSGSFAALLPFLGQDVHFSYAHDAAFAAGVFSGVYGWFRLFVILLRKYRDKVTLRAAERAVRIAGVALILGGLWGARLVLWPSRAPALPEAPTQK